MKPALSIALSLAVLLPSAVRAQEHKHDDHSVGSVQFPVGCNAEAQKTFEAAAQADPSCGVAYWGVAITHFGNPFAGGPGAEANKAGWAAAQKAVAIGGKTGRDRAYITAAEQLYKDHETVDNRTR